MMLLIGYDLNTPGNDYEDLIEAIKDLGAWWHHLDSTWLVSTHLTPKQARDVLLAHLDDNDELLVLDVTGASWASVGFNDRGSKWLKDNL